MENGSGKNRMEVIITFGNMGPLMTLEKKNFLLLTGMKIR